MDKRRHLPAILLILFILSQVILFFIVGHREIEWEYRYRQAHSALRTGAPEVLDQVEKSMLRALDVANTYEVPNGRRARTYYQLGNVYLQQGKNKLSRETFEAGLADQQALVGEEDFFVGVLHSQLSILFYRERNYEAAESHAQQAIKALKRQALPDFYPRISAEGVLGMTLVYNREYEKAEEHLMFAISELDGLSDEEKENSKAWRAELVRKLDRARAQKPTVSKP